MKDETREYLMKKRVNTETAKKLYDMLYDIWANYDFVLGVMGDLEGDEKKQKMIELLNQGLTNRSEIVINSMAIERGIEAEEMREMLNSIDWSQGQVFKLDKKREN